MIKNIEVAILDKKYSLMTDESEILLAQAASFVQESLEKILARGNVSFDKAAVCVALQLATEMLKQREQRQVVDEQIKDIITLCDRF